MQIEETGLDGVRLITPRRFGDHRGFFSEVYKGTDFQNVGLTVDWLQDNQSFSAQPGTVRGIHFQTQLSAW